MQCITKWESGYRRWGIVAHTVAVLSLVVLTATGIQLEGIGGWVACPPHTVVLEGGEAEGTQAAGCCVWKHLADKALAAPELGATGHTQ